MHAAYEGNMSNEQQDKAINAELDRVELALVESLTTIEEQLSVEDVMLMRLRIAVAIHGETRALIERLIEPEQAR